MKLVIITVCYNDLSGLKKTLESLIPFESIVLKHLVIDGNSSDGTKDFLTEISVHKNITFLSEADNGIFDAMNKGMILLNKIDIKDEDYYIWFLNSGDLANFIDFNNINNENDILFYCAIQTSLHTNKLNSIRPNLKNDNINFIEWLKYNAPVHQAVLFSSRLVDKIIYNKIFRNQADTKLIYELVNNHSYIFINKVLCFFELGGNSGNYTNYNKVITQLWEDLYIKNLLIKRSFSFFYIQVFIFHTKYILNVLLGKKLFHYLHMIILKIKYYINREKYNKISK